MRKRIVIGLITAVVIGVVASFVSQPKKGTKEYHERAYLQALERLLMRDWRSRCGHWVDGRTGVGLTFLYPKEKEKERLRREIEGHMDVLVPAGAMPWCEPTWKDPMIDDPQARE